MAVDGKCPRCAFKAPIVCFYQEAKDGRVTQAFAQLPPQVQGNYFQYLSLFRPKSGCAVQSAKAERLTLELVQEVTLGHVHQQGQVDRPCPPRIWGLAMEQMLERAGSLTLPVKTHGYLKTIAWDLANKEDAGHESTIRKQEAQGQRPGPRGVDPLEAARKKWDEEHGKDEGVEMPVFQMKGMD